MKNTIIFSFLIFIFLSSCTIEKSNSSIELQEWKEITTNTSIIEEESISQEVEIQEEIQIQEYNQIEQNTELQEVSEIAQPQNQMIDSQIEVKTEIEQWQTTTMMWSVWNETPQVEKEEEIINIPEDVKEETSIEEENNIVLPKDDDLRNRLTSIQYEVTQNGATETPYKNKYWDNYAEGIYVDVIDGTPLFSSTTKFKSNTGWPSFTQPISTSSILEVEDNLLWFTRIEAKSDSSDAHLWHIFNDGPQDQWWLRYCVNSASLRFVAKEDMASQWFQNYLYLFE